MKSNELIISLLLLLLSTMSQAARIDLTINNKWKFYKGELEGPEMWETVKWDNLTIPHSYNTEDIYDEPTGYYRGETCYRKELTNLLKGQEYSLYFEGVNQEAEVYVNNQLAGTHKGGYTGFVVPISAFLNDDGTNIIFVKVNNRFSKDIPTLSADFSFMGGIYRDVHLIATPSVHFALNEYGSLGVYISSPEVSEKKAKIKVQALVQNDSDKKKDVKVSISINDANGNIVSKFDREISVSANETEEFLADMPELEAPNLWSPDSPYLYQVECLLCESGSDEVIDEVSSAYGVRWYEFDAEKGFYINGEFCKLIGPNRHQDYQGLANALPDALHENDVRYLKEMGANYLRIAHYPQDPRILELCDKIGIITSVEIPIVNYITESEAFYNNCKHMMKEMIHQNFNHPSVVIWAYMNEVLINDLYSKQPERREIYIENLCHLAGELDLIARSLDSERYTMIPNHGDFWKYNNVGLTKIPMIVGWNLYQGWYGDDLNKFQEYLEMHHWILPDKPVIVTEYGAGADPRLRSDHPERFDFSLEYEQVYHQHYIKEIMKRDFVVGANVWNLADFSSEYRGDSDPHINSKGLMSHDRRPKDSYLYYQAALLKKPFVAVASKISPFRSGIADRDNENICTKRIEVYSNQPEVELFQNGVSLGVKTIDNFVASWEVPFTNGSNILQVKAASGVQDFHKIQFKIQPNQVSTFNVNQKLCISFGDVREFWDDLTNEVWIPSKEYEKGSWGTVGGETFRLNNGKSYGANKEIFGTSNDPIFQTQQEDIGSFKADVPTGEYEVTLHFAEIAVENGQTISQYEVGMKSGEVAKNTKRIFNVYINDKLVLDHLNMAKDYGINTAVSFKIPMYVKGNSLNIRFEAVEGYPVLNALELRRKY
ncbi:glycoside hydrolase family 2 TIM barrel-domain containing protein [uncultured Draconibacterium sp.]|uniref:glycoside hydrolase family 2 TIM barrel-domain containing protein n=1 Tax=uncultured Draconibacterium sp. TaxID=1573823 RepID=UPI0025D69DB9|nr:glycoside hydrolase family 2 TIM barrel-domain containing protein [uncultured Draconibacterium sp.]